jgi:hypothetical protein
MLDVLNQSINIAFDVSDKLIHKPRIHIANVPNRLNS